MIIVVVFFSFLFFFFLRFIPPLNQLDLLRNLKGKSFRYDHDCKKDKATEDDILFLNASGLLVMFHSFCSIFNILE